MLVSATDMFDVFYIKYDINTYHIAKSEGLYVSRSVLQFIAHVHSIHWRFTVSNSILFFIKLLDQFNVLITSHYFPL